MEETVNLAQTENSQSAMDTSSENIKVENQQNFAHSEIKSESKQEDEEKRAELNKSALIAVLQFLKKHNLQVTHYFLLLLFFFNEHEKACINFLLYIRYLFSISCLRFSYLFSKYHLNYLTYIFHLFYQNSCK